MLCPQVVEVRSTQIKQNIEVRALMNVVVLKQNQNFNMFFTKVGELDSG